MRYSFEGIADWAESSTAIQQHWLSGQMDFRFKSFSQHVKLNARNVEVRYQEARPIAQNIYQLLYDARWLGERFNYYCVADRQYWGKQSNDQIEATAEWVKGVINPSENRYYMRAQAAIFYQQRMPDFNERYWPGSGNALLEQETGKGIKGFVEWMLKPNRRFQSNLTVDVEYNQRWVSNWIQWVPQSNGVWSPVNLSEVQARSMNGNIQGNISLGKSILRTKAFGQWNDVSIQSDLNQLDSKEGRQLPYTPRWKWGAEATWMSKDFWYASLLYRWTDARFTDESNQLASALPAFQLVDFSFGKTNPKGLVQWSMGIDNIFNLQYQEIRSFALPGRVIKCQMNIQIK
jgi:outer membrane cobalamin receptor